MKKPVIGISLSDPAGIGPEITVKSFADQNLYNIANMIVVGDKLVLQKAIDLTGENFTINICNSVNDATFTKGIIDLIDLGIITEYYEYGKVNAKCGKASFEYVMKTAHMAMNKEIDAMATTPINKESIKAAKINYIGHTEMLASVSGVEDPLTMFEVEGLRVFFLSRHMSLRDACDEVKYDKILEYIERCTDAMERLGVSGTLAVAGLNPHSGEHGLFGYEEVNEITPAIKDAQKKGYDVVGPIGADSIFHMALQGQFSAVLSLYHDQGHIATKTYNFEKTISITNSMPFLRTSVDHGTAFPIAGKNIANEISMIEAIKLAAKYAPYFNKKQ